MKRPKLLRTKIKGLPVRITEDKIEITNSYLLNSTEKMVSLLVALFLEKLADEVDWRDTKYTKIVWKWKFKNFLYRLGLFKKRTGNLIIRNGRDYGKKRNRSW